MDCRRIVDTPTLGARRRLPRGRAGAYNGAHHSLGVGSPSHVKYELIDSEPKLIDFCAAARSARLVAFDTEFVSEDSYRPELCLVQVAADDRLAVIDPYETPDLRPFWELLASPGHVTVVHAGREELRFCLGAIGRRPHALVDVQIGAALVGLEYPAAYSTLVSKLLGKTLPKGETRTDWRRRPLSQRQLEYAVHDVFYLERLSELLISRLEELDRREWLDGEMEAWQRQIEAFEQGERWMRTAGIAGLSSRGLAIVRELWQWRDEEANRRNQPTKRILRDDLIVELAKRQTSDPKRIRALRGMERGDIQKQMPRIVAAIERALHLSEEELPELDRRPVRSQLNVLGQFLSTALGSICRSANVAPSIVGTAQDVRDLIAFHLQLTDPEEPPPLLARGWRAQVVGRVIEDLLEGRLTISIAEPLAEEPLNFEPRDAGKSTETR
jgi:ribonuclease D